MCLIALFHLQSSALRNVFRNGSTDTANQQLDQKEKWEWVYEDENITVYRRLLYESGIYEFKCVGTYNDITPMNFVDTQVFIFK